ncbi:MAG: PQQ-binding-like beta-propeller repeat protein, partial [Spirochaetota bacterium]
MARHKIYESFFRLLFFILLSAVPVLYSFSETLKPEWRFVTSGKIRGRPAVAPDETLYVLSEDRYLYAIDANGTVLWKCWLGGRVADSLGVGIDGTVYAGLKDGMLVAINSKGHIIWKTEITGTPFGNPATGENGTIYLAATGGELYAISHTGTIKWKKIFPPGFSAPPVLDWNRYRLILGGADRSLYIYNPWGALSHSIPMEGKPYSPAVDSAGNIYVPTNRGSLTAIDSKGRQLWNIYVGSFFQEPASPVLMGDSIILSLSDGRIIEIDPKGNIRRQKQVGAQLSGTCAVDTAGQVYTVSTDGKLFVQSLETNSLEIFESKTILTPLVLSRNGNLYTGGEDWLVYSFRALPPADSPWPQLGGYPAYSPDINRLFAGNMDYLFLKNLADSPKLEDKRDFLQEIIDRIKRGGLKTSEPYVVDILSGLITEGLLNPVRRNGKVINNFPEIRREACRLLGQCGNLTSISYLLNVLRYEYDSTVLAAAVQAIGRLKSDP